MFDANYDFGRSQNNMFDFEVWPSKTAQLGSIGPVSFDLNGTVGIMYYAGIHSVFENYLGVNPQLTLAAHYKDFSASFMGGKVWVGQGHYGEPTQEALKLAWTPVPQWEISVSGKYGHVMHSPEWVKGYGLAVVWHGSLF